MLESGYRISDLNRVPTNGKECTQKYKIALDETYMLGYAHSIYGIKYNRNNYKIPLGALRDDIKWYIGVESLVAPWSEQMKFWHGLWNDTANKNRSYVYEWKPEESNHPHYMPEKFADLENSYYIIRDAPFPYETDDCNNRGEKGEIIPPTNVEGENYDSTNKPLVAADPYPDSNKLVLKSYVDERLASKRLIDVNTEFWVRDYDCNYVIRAESLIADEEANGSATVKIHYPDKFEDRVKNNNLEFTLMVEGVEISEGVWGPAIKNNASWELYDSAGERLTICWLNKTDEDVTIIPNLIEERLYDNARYMLFTFRTITDYVENLDKIEVVDGKEEKTGEYTKAHYMVYAACENMLYRNRAVTTINNEIVEHLNVTSEDGSVTITEIFESGQMTIDLSVDLGEDSNIYTLVSPDNTVIINQTVEGLHTTYELSVPKRETLELLSSDTVKVTENVIDEVNFVTLHAVQPTLRSSDNSINITKTAKTAWDLTSNVTLTAGSNIEINKEDNNYIISQIEGISIDIILKPLPTTISFKNAKNEVYHTSALTPTVAYNTEGLKQDEVVTTKIYLNTKDNTQDARITGNIEWVMSHTSTESPYFKPGRLYCISLTTIPDFINGTGRNVKGRIDWFQVL